jgi:hypothetical protein
MLFFHFPPYSLGKLIDWKLDSSPSINPAKAPSLLARETNWLETGNGTHEGTPKNAQDSLLARETNWLETQSTRMRRQERTHDPLPTR